MSAALEQVEEHTTTVAGCQLLGLPRSRVYRGRRPRVHGPSRKPGGGVQPNALTEEEVAEVFDVLTSDRFADKSPEQVWAILLDEDTYLCSVASMYRILRSHNAVQERRNQASHPPRVIPELHATGPDQVWSWDIQCRRRHWKSYADLRTMPRVVENGQVSDVAWLWRSA